MKYLDPSFSTFAVGSAEYRDNWDAIFAKKEEVVKVDGTSTDFLREPPAEAYLTVTIEDYARFLQTIKEVAQALEIAQASRFNGPIAHVDKGTLQDACERQAQRLREALKVVRA